MELLFLKTQLKEVSLMRIYNIPESAPFAVGIYQGKSKPKPFSNYVRPTEDELK